MTDQKRDELPKRYPLIQQDHARRIRRIQRWLEECGGMIPGAEWIYPNCSEKRTDACDALFAYEIDWLCSYATGFIDAAAEIESRIDRDIEERDRTIDEQKARIEELSNKLNRLELVWRESCDD